MSNIDKNIHVKQVGGEPATTRPVDFCESADVQPVSGAKYGSQANFDVNTTYSLDTNKLVENLGVPALAADNAIPRFGAFSRHNARNGSVVQNKGRGLLSKPRFEVGIILSAMLAGAGLIGALEPLHTVFLYSGTHIPYVQNSAGFLDLYLVLLVMVIGYWGFCTFQIARVFSYKSKSSRKALIALTILFSLMNPAVLGGATLVLQFVIVRFVPRHSGVHDLMNLLGLHNSLEILGLCAAAVLFQISMVTILPVAAAYWNYYFIRRVSTEVAMASGRGITAKVPALAVFFLQLLTLLFFMVASVGLPGALDSQIKTTMPYGSGVVEFCLALVCGVSSAAICQAVSFYVLKRSLSAINFLKFPNDDE